jgi:hypothetical protein
MFPPAANDTGEPFTQNENRHLSCGFPAPSPHERALLTERVLWAPSLKRANDPRRYAVERSSAVARTENDSRDLASSVGATATAVAAQRAIASQGPGALLVATSPQH